MKLLVTLHKESGETYCYILSYCLSIPIFHLISNVLTITNTFSPCLFDFCVGQINLGTFDAAFRSHCSGLSRSSGWYLTQHQIDRLPCNRLRCQLDYPGRHSSLANFQCPKCFLLRSPHHFWLDDGWFLIFGGHLIFQCVLQWGFLQTKQVAKVIFLAI